MIHCSLTWCEWDSRAGYAATRLVRRAPRIAEQRGQIIQQVVVVSVDSDRHLVRL